MIVFSPTNLKTADQCLRKFQAQYITKELKYKSSPAAVRGTQLHALLESACRAGWDTINWTEDKSRDAAKSFADAVWALRQGGWEISLEFEAAIDGLGGKSGWWDKGTWGRSKIDVAATHPEKDYAIVIDWKSGKPWDDDLQLHFNALCLEPYIHRKKFQMMFAYLDSGQVKNYNVELDIVKPALFDRVQHMHSSVMPTLLVIDKIKEAYAKDHWPVTKNKLCGWCDLKTCPHAK